MQNLDIPQWINESKKNEQKKMEAISKVQINGRQQITEVKKSDPDKAKKRAKRALVSFVFVTSIYLILAGVMATNNVYEEYNVDASNANVSGSFHALSEEEKQKIPDGATFDEFLRLINPVEFFESMGNQIDQNISNGRGKNK